MSSISIRTDKDDYTGGEVVKGAVVLELDEPIPARGVRIRFSGSERALWSAAPGRDQSNYVDLRKLFDTEETLLGKPSLAFGEVIKDALKGIFSKDHYEVIEAGSHDYPFSFELPKGLPGDYESPRGSSIRYELTAYVDVPLRIDLETSKRLTVYEPAAKSDVEPAAAEDSRTFMFEASAPLELTVALDQQHFIAGETAHCRVTICNKSSKSIDGIQLLVRQIEDLVVDGIAHENCFDVPAAQVGDREIARGEPVEIDLDVQLPKQLYASIASGTLVKLRYQWVVKLDIPWARDLEVGVPIVLHEKAGMPSGPIGS
jgi:hypothetical protein